MSKIISRLHRRQLPKLPSRPTVVKILHDRFGLNYRTFNSAKLRFYQSRFNDKRRWICRLLAQTLSEDFLVISIDESSFSTSQLSKRRWQSELILEQRHRELDRRARQLPPPSSALVGMDVQ